MSSSMSSEDDSHSRDSERWPGDAVCRITDELIYEQTGVDIVHNSQDSSQIHALDLHIRDGSRGKIRKIENLTKLKNLQQLNISYNAINRIEGLHGLERLVELNLAENCIQKIENLFHLRALVRLSLCGNEIERIPVEISSLANLTILRLNRNKLHVARDLGNLRPLVNLHELRIDGNPFNSGSNSGGMRMQTVFYLPGLRVLDNVAVTGAEKERAKATFSSESEDLVQLKSRLVAQQRRAEMLEEEAAEIKKQHQQLALNSSEGTGRVRHRSRLELLSRLRSEKTDEATEARAAVSQLQQEVTFMSIDNSFDRWGGDNTGSSSESDSTMSRSPPDTPPSTPHIRQFTSTTPAPAATSMSTSASASVGTSPRSAHTPGDASRQIRELTDRVERLGSRLVQAEREKADVLTRLHEAENDLRNRDEVGRSGLAVDLSETLRELSEKREEVELLGSRLVQAEREKADVLARLHKAESDLRSREEFSRSGVASDLSETLRELSEKREEVELLGSRLVQAEREKADVLARLHKAESDLRSREEVGRSGLAADLSDTQRELSEKREEIERLRDLLREKDNEITRVVRREQMKEQEVERWRIEAETVKSTADRLRLELDAADDKYRMVDAERSSWESRAKRAERIKEADSGGDDDLQRANELVAQLRRDLEDARAQATSSREWISKTVTENSTLHETVRRQKRELDQMEAREEGARSALEMCEARLSKCSQELEREKDVRVKAEEKLRSYIQRSRDDVVRDENHVDAPFPGKPRTSAGGYFDDTESTIFEESVNSPRRRADGNHEIERVASGGVAAVIAEEVKTAQQQGCDLKEACARAAQRLIHTTSNREGGKWALAEFVEADQTGTQATEEVKALRAEAAQLRRVLVDLSGKENALMASIDKKELAVKTLKGHCDQAKREAESTLAELSALVQKLQEGQSDIAEQESKKAMVVKELEDARREFEELSGLSQLEHKNILASRERLTDLHKECAQWESRVAAVKEKFTEEDMKFRHAKSAGTDEIRILQSDLLKLQSEVKLKRRSLHEAERLRKSIEEESEVRQRELGQQQLLASREVEDMQRNLSSVKSELRSLNLQLEQLQAQKKQEQLELQRLEDRRATESRKLIAEIDDSKRRLGDIEKQTASSEKKCRTVKEQLSSLETEKSLLTQAVEDLTRSQAELDRSAAERRRVAEEEAEAAQQHAQAVSRLSRQATASAEQKRAECDAITAECRTMERRSEDLKRLLREQEELLERSRQAIKGLEVEHCRRVKDMQGLSSEEEELRIRLQALRSSIEGDTRKADDVRRRLSLLHDEESDLKEREGRLKSTQSQLKKTLEECQDEVNELRTMSERERRALSDARSKRSMIEADIARCEEELKFSKEQAEEEARRHAELVRETQRAREEAAKVQKEVINAQRRHNEAVRVETEIRRRESDATHLQNKLRIEAESLATTINSEKHTVETLSAERNNIIKEIKSAKDELRVVRRELDSANVALESCMAQQQLSSSVKEELEIEISRIREAEKVELLRAERINESYKDLERRLKEIRNELSREESTYARVKSRSMEEESKLAERHRSLYAATEELSKIEGVMSDLHKNLHQERGKAIEEISRLSQAKQSVLSQMFHMSEARTRSNRIGDTGMGEATSTTEMGRGMGSGALDTFSHKGDHDVLNLHEIKYGDSHNGGGWSTGQMESTNVREKSNHLRQVNGVDTVEDVSDLRGQLLKLSEQSSAILKSAIDS